MQNQIILKFVLLLSFLVLILISFDSNLFYSPLLSLFPLFLILIWFISNLSGFKRAGNDSHYIGNFRNQKLHIFLIFKTRNNFFLYFQKRKTIFYSYSFISRRYKLFLNQNKIETKFSQNKTELKESSKINSKRAQIRVK